MLTETLHAGAFIVSEAPNFYCREAVTIPQSQTVIPGQVLGKTYASGATSAVVADVGNTGNGVFTLDAVAPVGASAHNGVYRIICAAVAANGGEFLVHDPDGIEIGRVAVGATFNNQIKFVVADGATDFAVGDAFSVTVGIEPGDQQFAPLDLAATDGSENAAAIAVYGAVTGAGETAQIAAIVRGPAQVRLSDLTFSGGITDAQKAQVVAQLAELGIIAR